MKNDALPRHRDGLAETNHQAVRVENPICSNTSESVPGTPAMELLAMEEDFPHESAVVIS